MPSRGIRTRISKWCKLLEQEYKAYLQDNMVVPNPKKTEILSVHEQKVKRGKAMRNVMFTRLFSLLPKVVKEDKVLSYIDKIVYSYLAYEVARLGSCYMSNEELGKALVIEPYTIKSSLDSLEKNQYIAIFTEKSASVEVRKIIPATINGVQNIPKREIGESDEAWNTRIMDSILYNSTIVLSTNSTIVPTVRSTNSTKKTSTSTSTIVPTVRSTIVRSTNSIFSTLYEEWKKYCSRSEKKIYHGVSHIKEGAKELELPSWLGKTNLERFKALFEMCYELKYGIRCVLNNKKESQEVFSTLLKKHSEVGIGMMILTHFDWKGPQHDLDSVQQYLRKHFFSVNILLGNSALYWKFIVHRVGIRNDEQGFARVDAFLNRIMSQHAGIDEPQDYPKPLQLESRAQLDDRHEAEYRHKCKKEINEVLPTTEYHSHHLRPNYDTLMLECIVDGCDYSRIDSQMTLPVS